MIKLQKPAPVSWANVLSPEQAPIAPFQYTMLWWSTLLAFFSLMPIINPFSKFFLPLAFFVVTKIIPPHVWTPLGRITLFFVLLSITILAGGGLTKEVGTAILMVTMVVKFAEMRRIRDAHMMVLFNSIAPFVAFLQDQTPLILLLGLTSLFVTISLSKGLTEYAPPQNSNPIKRLMKGMLIQSTLFFPLVIVAYMVAPRLDNPLWGGYGQNRARTGFTEQMDVSRWSALFEDLSTAFRVRFEGNVPPQNELYFRGATLWTFDGQVWLKDPAVPETISKVKTARRPRVGADALTYTVTYEPAIHPSYFVLDYPTRLPPDSLRATDDQIYSLKRRDRVNTVTWTGSSLVEFAPLSDNERQSALQLPDNNQRIVQLAKNWRARFDTDREYVQFVLNHFKTEGYAYSFSPPPVGSNPVDDFFFNTKEGFCQHYSSAFVVLMRGAGIPARVVTGYWGGEVSDLGDYLRVRQADAHAWGEVWIDGQWRRYDPTAVLSSNPRSRDQLGWNVMNSSYEVADWMKDLWNRWFLYYDDTEQTRVLDKAKKTVTEATQITITPKFYLYVVVFLAMVWAGALWSKRIKSISDVLAQLRLWLGDEPNPGANWYEKLDALAKRQSWPSLHIDEAKSQLRQLESLVFDPQQEKSLPRARQILRELKSIGRAAKRSSKTKK